MFGHPQVWKSFCLSIARLNLSQDKTCEETKRATLPAHLWNEAPPLQPRHDPEKKEGNQLRLGWGEDLQRENPIFGFEDLFLAGLFLERTRNSHSLLCCSPRNLLGGGTHLFFVDGGRLSVWHRFSSSLQTLLPSIQSLSDALSRPKHSTSSYFAMKPCSGW